MGWFDDGGFTVQQDQTAPGAQRFRVTFYGTEPAGTHRHAAHIAKTNLLGMRSEINRALKQDKEEA
ncbi:hypothetical protein [uncultured Bifidobacterium sp.]|uniref:hypothetical protein n=1 Tax=uncultured Bifidobacterium sp. TaxID=165187 RepID=UPI0025843036|nr:hypothetical protein [uncultured Bifidobacterium sp.]